MLTRGITVLVSVTTVTLSSLSAAEVDVDSGLNPVLEETDIDSVAVGAIRADNDEPGMDGEKYPVEPEELVATDGKELLFTLYTTFLHVLPHFWYSEI